MDDSGAFVIAWQNGQRFGVYAQRYGTRDRPRRSTPPSFLFADRAAPAATSHSTRTSRPASAPTTSCWRTSRPGQTIPSSDLALSYDLATNTATFSYTGNASGIAGVLPDGNYRATLARRGHHQLRRQAAAGESRLQVLLPQRRREPRRPREPRRLQHPRRQLRPVPRDFTQGDFNYDTAVNLRDFNILAGRFGHGAGRDRTQRVGTAGRTRSDRTGRRRIDRPKDLMSRRPKMWRSLR